MIIALQTLVFFRESLVEALTRLISPYYLKLRASLTEFSDASEEEEEEEVFAEFDEEKGVVFYPPMYIQRYAAVSDCLLDERWNGKLEKIVDLGYHDMSFIKYLKDMPGVRCILGVDLESIPLKCSSDLLGNEDYAPKREHPLQVILFQGNAADPDYRLIGCDAVVAIEMIEHMLPHDLDRLVHTIFGFIKPWIVIITTPNGDFNVLFKAMEKNCLRRCDHFFEWSREQFHDWCSNIVIRYPQFTVHCQGIGPGPPGTSHLGCCSQLALFVNKSYAKQRDLDLKSLEVVPKIPSPDVLSETSGFDTPICNSSRMICPQNQSSESLTNLLYSRDSYVTIMIASSSSIPLSLPSLSFRDQTSQCNLDSELGKNFLMFNDDEMWLPVLMPRREAYGRVYHIEDVNSRLNCTTFQATKFSKTTQNLMAKHRIDSLAHTREVVSEIRHLTHMLNWKQDAVVEKRNGSIWCNINWGENAPYWNQYYQIVREYNCPFEVKSDEARILDLISEEIARLIDVYNKDNVGNDPNKLQIPIDHLMNIVRHITRSEDMVRDLLEWNGYEIVGNKVIYSRLAVDTGSFTSSDVDWPENDTSSERDTIDVQSTTVTDTSNVPDYHGRLIRRVLDKKVRGLRRMLSADEDITTELDKIVCRLMKLALRTSKGRQTPPPTTWMQCKLLDLLTLTEKAISRRKMRYLNYLPLEAAGGTDNTSELIALLKIKTDNPAARKIVDKYKSLLDVDGCQLCDSLDFGFDDELGEPIGNNSSRDDGSCTPAITYYNTGVMSLSSSNQLVACSSLEMSSKSLLRSGDDFNRQSSRKKFYSKITEELKYDNRNRCKKSKIDIVKKLNKKKSTPNTRCQTKKVSDDIALYGIKSRRLLKEYKKLHPTASKPIPHSIIELCHPELGSNVMLKEFNYQKDSKNSKNHSFNKLRPRKIIPSCEESVLFDITMDNVEATIDVRKSVEAGLDSDSIIRHNDVILEKSTSNIVEEVTKMQGSTENVESQTIFLNDINEPSTSKGIRHVSMDVQCGTDSMPSYGVANTSVTALPNAFSNGIRIESLTNVLSKVASVNVGTSDFNAVDSKTISASIFSKGIKIGDSVENIIARKQSFDVGIVTDKIVVQGENTSSNNLEHKIEDSPVMPERLLLPAKNITGVSMKSDHLNNGETERHANSSNLRFNSGIKFNDYFTDVKPEDPDFEVCEPECFYGVQPDNSLSNLLLNFNRNTGSPSKSTFSVCQSRSRDTFFKSSGTKYSSKTDFDTRTNHDITNETGNTQINIEDSTGPQSPPFITRVQMIDLINDVSVEHNTEVELQCTAFEPPEPCKLVVPRIRASDSPQSAHQRMTSFTMPCSKPSCQASDIATSTEEKVNNFNIKSCDVSKQLAFIESQHGSGIASYNNNENIFTDASSTYINQEPDKNDNNISPQRKVFGFKIKDLNENIIKKVEVCSTRVELLAEGKVYTSLPSSQILSPKTHFIKSVVSVSKTEDSAIEVCDIPEFDSCFCKESSNEKFVPYKSCDKYNKDGGSSLSAPRELSCACVHVHSYKKSLEDIVYQGEWNKHFQSVLENSIVKKRSSARSSSIRKKSFTGYSVIAKKSSHGNSVIAKKNPEAPNRKLKNNVLPRVTKTANNENKVKTKVEHKKPVQVRCATSPKVKQEVFNKNEQMRKAVHPVLPKLIKANKTLTKVSSKIMINSIPLKGSKTLRVTKNNVNVVQVAKNDTRNAKNIHVDKIDRYLPGYLKRSKLTSKISNLNSSTDSDKNKHITRNIEHKETESKKNVGKIQKNLLKLQIQPRNINYMVFRNELEKSGSTANNKQSADSNDAREINNKAINHQIRSSSPLSQNSSTDSTADSASTVKPNVDWPKASNRRQSLISNKSSTGNTDSDTSPSTKIKKIVRRTKIKKMEAKEFDNKENIPQTSKKSSLDKDSLHNGKGAFLSRNKIYMAQFPEGSGCGKKQTPTKSNIKLPAIEINEDKKRPKTAVFRKQSVQSNELSNITSQNTSNVDYVILVERKNVKDEEDSSIEQVPRQPKNTQDTVKTVDSKLLSEWLESSSVSASEKESTENAILAAMRQIVEEKLNFIRSSLNEIPMEPNNVTNLDESRDLDDNSSFKSFKTVVAKEDTNLNTSVESEIENVMNHSLDAVLGNTEETENSSMEEKHENTDLEFLSLKSVTSTSRNSEYFMPDSNQIKNDTIPVRQHDAALVVDIFERKGASSALIPTGTRASQAFSGFSINEENMIGDQPDFIPCDSISEIDSLEIDCTRQATSEELYVSGQSTPSYESCLVEEEFRSGGQVCQRPDPVSLIDSETGSLAQGYQRLPIAEGDEEPQELIPLPMPMVEPVFDVNGNVMEPGIGFGAGAGDGRGMHSDHSQDSSGRGSSLSSSDASSGQQSEAILLDPSAFTAQFELFHEPVGSSMAVTTFVMPDSPEQNRQGRPENETLSTSRNETLRNSCPMPTSDGEADVSSTDTDIPDSS